MGRSFWRFILCIENDRRSSCVYLDTEMLAHILLRACEHLVYACSVVPAPACKEASLILGWILELPVTSDSNLKTFSCILAWPSHDSKSRND